MLSWDNSDDPRITGYEYEVINYRTGGLWIYHRITLVSGSPATKSPINSIGWLFAKRCICFRLAASA